MKKTFVVLTIDYPELHYTSEISLSPGNIVLVSVRKKHVIGVILREVYEKTDYQLKDISEVFTFKLNESTLQFIDAAARRCLIQRGAILKMILGPFAKRHSILIKQTPLQPIFHGNDVVLSSEQQSVFDHMQEVKQGVVVVDGVTGSGKTELYLQIAKNIIEQDGQVLILLPEILLTNQIIDRAKKFFHVESWHSDVKQKAKDLVWLGVQNSSTKVVIGARSALFLPFQNLRMIIIDEEHDSSFKQENSPIYHGRNLAILLAGILQIPIMLISATPSIETLYHVKNGDYKYFHLDASHHKNAKTRLLIANMWDAYDKSTKSCPLLHSNAVKELKLTLDNKKQSIVFLNRKGYATTTICNQCMTPIKCKHCDVKLTYYKDKKHMKCRYCGYVIRETLVCTTCNSQDSIFNYQPGIEKLHEEIKAHFPEARILVVTRDSEESPLDIIEKISNCECDIVIGTQILAKGLHFPNMSLCIIVDANNTKFSGDIRSLEKTYQIIQQVIGRVGREGDGLAIIQTFTPNLPLIKAIVSGNKNEFINLELENRKAAKVPPYSSFILVNISAVNETKLLSWLKEIDIPMSNAQLKVFGPMPAAINRLQNKHRQQILFRGNENLSTIVTNWINSLKIPHFITLTTDVDPINFY
jgi:primosomal protein N' (replication factor Y)